MLDTEISNLKTFCVQRTAWSHLRLIKYLSFDAYWTITNKLITFIKKWFFVFCKKFNKYLKVTGFWSCGWNYQECMKVFRLIYHRNHLISQIWNTAHTKIFWQGDPKRMRFQIKWLHWFDRVFFYIIFFVKKITQFLCELISYSLDGRIQCSIHNYNLDWGFRLITSRQPCIV